MKLLFAHMAAAVCLAACTPRVEPLADASPQLISRHAAGRERLRMVIQKMDALMFERMYTELALEKELACHALEFEQAAGALAATARNIQVASPDVLDPESMSVFLGLADTLVAEAGELSRFAAAGRYADVAAQ